MLQPEAFIDLGIKLTEVATQRDLLLAALRRARQGLSVAIKAAYEDATDEVVNENLIIQQIDAAMAAAEAK